MRMILRALRYYFSDRSGGRNKGTGNTTPMRDVCWEAYMGRWYEWARYETPFEYGMDDVYTDYEMREDGGVEIHNYGTEHGGKQQHAHAKAETAGEGRLKVSFIPLLRFLSSPYHVLYVDNNYTHALVSNESGSCLWFLGRAQHYSTADYKELCREASERGFDISALRLTNHERDSR